MTHIGSNLTSAKAIEAAFDLKQPEEKFILSNGHAGLALHLVMYPDDLVCSDIQKNIHADSKWCDCSTGSLGHGLGIAVGMALAERSKNVYCLISDGEMAEGSIYEALRIAGEQHLINLKLMVNCNGWGAYKATDPEQLMNTLRVLGWGVWPCDDNKKDIKKGLETRVDDFPVAVFIKTKCELNGLEDLKGHYEKLA